MMESLTLGQQHILQELKRITGNAPTFSELETIKAALYTLEKKQELFYKYAHLNNQQINQMIQSLAKPFCGNFYLMKLPNGEERLATLGWYFMDGCMQEMFDDLGIEWEKRC